MATLRWWHFLSAHLLWSTRVVDRLYGRVNALRTRLALAACSDAFRRAYNDVAYGDQDRYRAGSPSFRAELYPFERRAISEFFPSPPATVLLGGAGGGREAAALAERGYDVVAFDPARRLVESMATHFAPERIEALIGSYEDLPLLHGVGASAGDVDLRERRSFDAAIFGWASFSNVSTDAGRVAALGAVAALTAGPILLSYFPHHADRPDAASRRGSFALNVGYFRDLTEEEMRAFIAQAGLTPLAVRHDTGWPYAVLRRRAATDAAPNRADGD